MLIFIYYWKTCIAFHFVVSSFVSRGDVWLGDSLKMGKLFSLSLSYLFNFSIAKLLFFAPFFIWIERNRVNAMAIIHLRAGKTSHGVVPECTKCASCYSQFSRFPLSILNEKKLCNATAKFKSSNWKNCQKTSKTKPQQRTVKVENKTKMMKFTDRRRELTTLNS